MLKAHNVDMLVLSSFLVFYKKKKQGPLKILQIKQSKIERSVCTIVQTKDIKCDKGQQ